MVDGETFEVEGDESAAKPFVPRMLSRSEVRARRKQAEDPNLGFWFPLPKTGIDARVRLLSLTDKAFLASLPDAAQKRITEALATLSGQREGDDKIPAHKRAIRAVGKLDDVAREFCLRGFIYPRLVATEAELPEEDESVWLVDDVHPDDRAAYYNLCEGSDAEAVGKLEPFRPGQMDAVSAESNVEASPASVGNPGSKRRGVVPGGVS